MFKNLFGGGKKVEAKAKATAAAKTIDSISKLNEQEITLEKRKQLLEKRIDEEQDKIKGYLKKKQQNYAKLCLKKRKMMEQQVEQIDNMILRISEQKMMLENTSTTADMLGAMKQGAAAQKQTLKEVNIDNVDQVMDEVNEQNEEMRAVQDALAAPIGVDLDDMDLADELNLLEEEVLDEQLLEPAPVPVTKVATPAVAGQLSDPSKQQPVKQKTAEEMELEQLEREMALEAS